MYRRTPASPAAIEAELRDDGAEIDVAGCLIAGTARDAGTTLPTPPLDFVRGGSLCIERFAGDGRRVRGQG